MPHNRDPYRRLTGRDRATDGGVFLLLGCAVFLLCGVLLLPPIVLRLATVAALLCATGAVLIASDVLERGLVRFFPAHLRELLTEGTLLQFLRDDSLPKQTIPYLPFLVSLSDEEVQAYLRSAPQAVQELMTRRGIARLLPAAAQHWLLGKGGSGGSKGPASRHSPQVANGGPSGSGAVATPASVTLAAAVRASHPSTEAPPWAARALSDLVRRRALRTAGHALQACGVASEGAALDAAMAVTMASAGRALLVPRGWGPVGNAVAVALNAATLVAWGAYVARRGVDASLRALDEGAAPARPRARSGGSQPPLLHGSPNLARMLVYARALIAFYAARVSRAPLRTAAAAALMTLLVIVLAIRGRRTRLIQL